MPKLISQQTIAPGVEKWKIELKAANALTARQRARIFVRRMDFTIRNFISPEVVGRANGEQTTISQIVPEIFERETFTVEAVVVR